MLPAIMISGNIFFGMIGMLWGNRFVACVNFSVAAFVFAAETFK